MLHSDVLLVPGAGLCVNSSGKVLEEGHLFRNHMRPKKPVMRMNVLPEKQPPEQHLAAAFYGGYLFNHYGHFLLESLSRLAGLKRYSGQAVVWHNLHGRQAVLKPWQQQVFALLGLEGFKHVIAQKPTLIAELEVCEPGYRIRDTFTPEHRDFLSVVEVQKGRGKVWLSRSSSDHLSGWINELEIEETLRQNGWTVVQPERLSIVEQVQLLASCEVLAGIAGSAFHTLLLARQVHCQVILFSRGMTKVVNQNYDTIARLKGLQQAVYYPEQMQIPGALEEDAPKFYVNPNDVFKALDVPAVFEYHALCQRLIQSMGAAQDARPGRPKP
jgi:capsular polysaccharide biosynthesis protein